ncbi:helix-turn-helix domain-containing protein [Streptomyces microflavus]|uniref:helix-turn-helix domain-containing protein n=1 Tax=Streptomyces microflavus TaxID=1919 RepID=UPI003824F0AD
MVPLQGSGDSLSGRMLGVELRRLREQRGYTLADAARVIRASTSKVSRLERGQNPVKYRDLNDLAVFYGVSREERAHLDQLHQQVGNEDLIQRFNDVTPAFFKRLIGLERAAQQITVFEPRVVPGLLQTEEYARALVRLIEIDRSERDIELLVRLRLERQLMLDGESPRLAALIYEKALYQAYGPGSMMAEQMRHLRAVAKVDKVTVRILPKRLIPLPTPIFHLTFPDGQHQELAYVEHANSANYITQKAELDRTRKQLLTMHDAVYGREDSVTALEHAIDYWDRVTAEEQPG